MLHLLESGGLGMWNDAVFPSLSSSSAINLGKRPSYCMQCKTLDKDSGIESSPNEAGSAEPWLQSSKASMDLERLNLVNFCGTLPNSFGYSLQSHNFTCFNSNAGFLTDGAGSYGDPMMSATAAAAAAAGSLSSVTAGVEYPKVGAERRKRLIARDRANKHQSPLKRFKSCYLQNESATLAGVPLSRAPVRRSQKLGDKITTLQQLVSPFGKTDTASVLHEAALSIKFLHEQIRMLAAPYFGIGSSEEHLQGEAESGGELQRRGSCLVPFYAIVGLMDVEEAYGGGCWPETMIGQQSSEPSDD